MRPIGVLALRLVSAVGGASSFGLVAAMSLPQWSLPAAAGLAFGFGTAFVGGTGYRILYNVWRGRLATAPVSWSGAVAASVLAGLACWAALRLLGLPAMPVLAGLGLALNVAYLPVKLACLLAGCCSSIRTLPVLGRADLRVLEAGASAMAIAGWLALAPHSLQAAALAGLGAHLAIRALSRRWRGRASWGWPPLRQPGAELMPLAMALCAAILG